MLRVIPKCFTTINSPSVCAERRHIQKLICIARKKGVPNHKIIPWINKHEGEIVVERYLKNGDEASSLPCVLCRNILDKFSIKWRAYHDGHWISSTDPILPKSIPTSRQNDQVFGRRQQQTKIKQ